MSVGALSWVRQAPLSSADWWRRRVMLAGRISTTRVVLARLRWAMIGGAVLVVGLAAIVSGQATSTVTAASGRTAATLMEVSAARQDLTEADALMVRSLVADSPAQAVDDDTAYRLQLALASASLQQAGESNGVGAEASQDLQQAQAQLIVYSGLVEQAYIYFASTDPDTQRLGFADLVYASKLMHSSGILAALDDLRDRQAQGQLDTQVSSGWLRPGAALLWALPAAALLAVLGFAQVYLRRRFRRAVNWPLAAMTALLVALCGYLGVVTAIEGARLSTVDDRVAAVRADHAVTPQALPPAGANADVATLDAMCQQQTVGCGWSHAVTDLATTNGDTARAAASAQAAPQDFGAVWAIPLAGALLVLLGWWGIQLRIREYRYEAT